MTFPKKKEKRLAIVKLASLGDIIQLTHILPLLKEEGYYLEFYTNRSCAPLLENNPFLEKVYPLPDIGGSLKNTFLGLLFFFIKLLQNRYHLVLLFHRNSLLAFLIWLSQNKAVGFYNRNKGYFLFKKVFFDINIHRCERNHALINQALGIKKKNYQFYYFPKEEEISSLKSELFFQKGNKYLAINAGGGVNLQSAMPARRWPWEYYAELLNKIHMNFPKIIFVFLGASTDLEIHREIQKRLPKSTKILDFTAQKTLRETAALLSQAQFYLGNDSLLLYLAVALNIEAFGIFGPTNGKLLMPKVKHAHFIQARHPLSGCYNPLEGLRGLAYQEEATEILKSLKPNTVYKKLFPILKKHLS